MTENSSVVAENTALKHYDYTIVGAGASGLWLAMAMRNAGVTTAKSLHIAERDPDKGDDRTWCYWAKEPIFPGHKKEEVWSSMTRPDAPERRTQIAPYRYFHVRSSDFYAYAEKMLSDGADITRTVEDVISVKETEACVQVRTSEREFTAGQVFLSAPPAHRKGLPDLKTFLGGSRPEAPELVQSFSGRRLKTNSDTFDPGTATLMRFDVPQGDGTRFLYVLPFSEREALVELTSFGTAPLTSAEAAPVIDRFMRKLNVAYTVGEEETAVIPMSARFDMLRRKLPASTRIIYIGTPAGALKPTTGYAFKRAEAYARRLAEALAAGTDLPTMYRKPRFRLYDRLLLRILAEKPHRGRDIFMRLFGTQKMTKILKFLDEETGFLEEISIFSRLQVPLFLAALLKDLFRR